MLLKQKEFAKEILLQSTWYNVHRILQNFHSQIARRLLFQCLLVLELGQFTGDVIEAKLYLNSVIFAGFSSDALADRIIDASCKLVITSDEVRLNQCY
jgi:hypothetical protein